MIFFWRRSDLRGGAYRTGLGGERRLACVGAGDELRGAGDGMAACACRLPPSFITPASIYLFRDAPYWYAKADGRADHLFSPRLAACILSFAHA